MSQKTPTRGLNGVGGGSKTPGSGGRSGSRSQTKKPRVFGTRLSVSANNLSGASGLNSSHSSSRARRNITPSRSQAGASASQRTPGKLGGDRFCANRSASAQEIARLELSRNASSGTCKSAPSSPSKAEASAVLRELLDGSAAGSKILGFQVGQAPAPPPGFTNANAALYSTAGRGAASSCRKATRHIPAAPDRVLDAPALMDDFYLNLIDWSDRDVLAVGLANAAYVWHAATGEVERLAEFPEEEYVGSVAWSVDGTYLAVGSSTGSAHLYDLSSSRHLRSLPGSEGVRIGALSWNAHVLSTGSASGTLNHFDVRAPQPLVASIPEAHAQEICGLRWSPDGRHLASGGNDNRLLVWAAAEGERHSQPQPIHVITQHTAAVKAIAWCPWQPSVLASGGGTADRSIRLWNISSGACVKSADAGSQVSGLVWNEHYKELMSSHGPPAHQLSIWKYPALTKLQDLQGHSERVLGIAASADGQRVVSAAADESLRVWKAFASDPKAAKKVSAVTGPAHRRPASQMNRLIR